MVLSMYLSGDKLGGGSIDRREVLHDDRSIIRTGLLWYQYL